MGGNLMPYVWGWVIAAAGALLAVLALTQAWRGLPLPGLRRWLTWLIPVWLLLPAPVPGYEEQLAPAFVVFLFEWLFQRDGSPALAGSILLVGTCVTTAAFLVFWLLRRRRMPAEE